MNGLDDAVLMLVCIYIDYYTMTRRFLSDLFSRIVDKRVVMVVADEKALTLLIDKQLNFAFTSHRI